MSLPTRSAPMAGDDNLLGSFAFASLVVILGVVIAWVVVKRGGEELVATNLALDAMPAAVRDHQVSGAQTLLDQAELAFAAGRIVEPRYDNALYFYHAVLSEAPDDPAASAGVNRVAQWLSSEVMGALDAREWERALAAAQQLVVLRPEDEQARTRLERINRIRTLSTEARRLAELGESASAARRWQQLLALDPGNLDARDGLRRSLDEVVSAAGVAVSEDRLDAAGRMLAQVREVAPDAPGVRALAERLENARDRASGAALASKLAAARSALREGRLLVDDGSDAFSLFRGILERNPEAAGARSGLAEARRALLREGRTALSASEFTRVERVLARAAEVGVRAAEQEELARDLKYRRHLYDFERGMHGEPQPISAFTVVSRQSPTFPRDATARSDGGWVEVEFTVSRTGQVTDTEVRQASASLFVEPSLDAIRDWRFEPMLMDGRPVPARGVLRFTFRP